MEREGNKMKRQSKLLAILLAVALVWGLMTPAMAATGMTAKPSATKLTVDGESVPCTAYLINGNNYFKLRDLAALLDGTDAQFEVSFNNAAETVSLTTGKAYTPVGGEGSELKPAAAAVSDWKLTVDGKGVAAHAYMIDDNNYFKLRDLGKVLGFEVGYVYATNTAVIATETKKFDGKEYYKLDTITCVGETNGVGMAMTEKQFDSYYAEGSAEAGVRAISKAANVYVNGQRLPYETANGTISTESLLINGSEETGLWKVDGGWAWSVHKQRSWNDGFFMPKVEADYEAGAPVDLETARFLFTKHLSFVKGQTVELYAELGSEKVSVISTTMLTSTLVGGMENKDGVTRFTHAHGDALGIDFPTENVDQAIRPGDMMIYWQDGEKGWVAKRAVAVSGRLIENTDPNNPDAIKQPYFRPDGAAENIGAGDSLIGKNFEEEFRHTQFIRGHRRTDQYAVTDNLIMWSSDEGENHVIGFTRGDSALPALKHAIVYAEETTKDVRVSKDGSDVPANFYWVTAEIWEPYAEKLAEAKKMADAGTAGNLAYDKMLFELGNVLGGTEDLNSKGPMKMNPLGVVGSMKIGLAPGMIAMVCDGSAAYKIEAEDRDYKMGFDGNYVLDDYFGTDIKAGVEALIGKGGVTVNDRPAAIEEVTQALKSSGTNITLTVENGAVVRMELFCTAGILVDSVKKNTDDTVSVIGGGRELTIPTVNVEAGVEPYVVCVYWEGADGMHIRPADKLTGKLVKSDDHAGVVININGKDTSFAGADMYQRGASAGNRPGGYANTTDRLDLEKYELTAWLIPGTKDTDNPMIIAFTTGTPENASARLQGAIDYAQTLVDMTVIAENAEDAAAKTDLKEYHWLKSEDTAVLDGLKKTIADAKMVLADETATAQKVDDTAYDIQIAVWGSNSDVSAVFSGNAKDGYFDKVDGGEHALPAAVLF